MLIKTITSMDVRSWVILIFMSFFLSFCGVFGWSYGASGQAGYATIPTPLALVLVVVFTLVAACIILLCNVGLTKLSYDSLNRESAPDAQPSRIERLLPKMRPLSLALFALVLIVFWLPYLISSFPGLLCADTVIQMREIYEGMHPLDLISGGYVYISPEMANTLAQADDSVAKSIYAYPTDAWLIDHHPFVLTMIYGGLALLSDALFGNWMPAAGLLMVVQVILFAFELSFVVAFARSRGVPRVLCLVLYLFFCLVPLIPYAVGCVVKDSVFTLFFIPFFLYLTEAVLTQGGVFKKRRNIVAFVLLGVALCLTRKSGIYVVLAVALFGFVLFAVRFMRERRAGSDTGVQKASPACFAGIAFLAQGVTCALLMFAIVPGIIFPALNIIPGGRQEMLGTLLQQTARVHSLYGDDAFTPEEKQAMREIMAVKDLGLTYDPVLTDHTKDRFYSSATTDQLRAYLDAYVSTGLRYPEAYFASVMCVAAGYISPVGGSPYGGTPSSGSWKWSLPFDGDRLVTWLPSETEPVREATQGFYQALTHIPVVNLLLRGVLYDLWIPLIVLFFCLRNRLKAGLAFVPFFMVFLVCMVSPLYELRYLYPVIFCSPVLIAMSVAIAKRTFKERAERAAQARSVEPARQMQPTAEKPDEQEEHHESEQSGKRGGGGMFVRTVRSMSGGSWILLIVLSFAISIAGVLGLSYGLSETGGAPTFSPIVTLVLFLVAAIVVAFVMLACNAGLTKLTYASLNKDATVRDRHDEPAPHLPHAEPEQGTGTRTNAGLGRFVPTLTVCSIALFTAIMLVFWSPYLMAAFPGQVLNDTTVQMQQVYEGAHPLDIRTGGNNQLDAEEVNQEHGTLSEEIQRSEVYRATDAWLVDHHPFALTLLFGGLASASDALFGNWMPALGLLMVVQVLVLSSELTFCAAYLRRKGAPLSVCLAAYLFCCLLPLVPLQATMVIKDTVFTLFFIPWFLMLAEYVLTRGALFARKRTIVAFVLLAVCMCFTKKTGVYVVGATALFGLVASLVSWRRAQKTANKDALANQARTSAITFLVQGGTCALLMFGLLPAVVFPALNIVPNSKAEAIGTMLQQTARVYKDAGSAALTPEEREAVQGVMRVTGLDLAYAPTYTDRVKVRYYLESTDEQMRDYLGAYISMGLRFPESYLASVVSVSSSYLAPVKPRAGMYDTLEWNLIFDNDRVVLWSLQQTAPLRQAINAFCTAWCSAPVLSIPLCGVTYCLWIPALLLFFCLRNRLRAGVLFVPFAVVTVFCIIGPIYDIRYELPEVVLALTLLGLMVVQAKAVFKERADAARSLKDETAQEQAQDQTKIQFEPEPQPQTQA